MYSVDNLKYKGILTNKITEIRTVKVKGKPFSESQDYQYFFEKISLDDIQVANVVQHILTTGLLETTLDTVESEWKTHFLHCNSMNVQSKINGVYQNIEYECPWSQKDTIHWKEVVLENYDFIKEIFQLDSLYKIFESELPLGRDYSKGDQWIIYKFTKKESKNWQKRQPRRDYLETVNDTIINYLKDEIKKQNIELDGIDCFEQYWIQFAKNGKFKKIKVVKYYIPKYKNGYLLSELIETKREIRKCKQKLKDIFSLIDLSWVNLKYDIFLDCKFNDEKELKFGYREQIF